MVGGFIWAGARFEVVVVGAAEPKLAPRIAARARLFHLGLADGRKATQLIPPKQDGSGSADTDEAGSQAGKTQSCETVPTHDDGLEWALADHRWTWI